MVTSNHAAAQPIANADELGEQMDDETQLAEKLFHIIETRDNDDTIVAVEEWAYADWSDYDITSQPIILATVEDYSESAYKLTSAFEVQCDAIESKSLEEVEETYITSLVQRVDETDEDFHDEKGEMFIPKSAVDGLYVVE